MFQAMMKVSLVNDGPVTILSIAANTSDRDARDSPTTA